MEEKLAEYRAKKRSQHLSTTVITANTEMDEASQQVPFTSGKLSEAKDPLIARRTPMDQEIDERKEKIATDPVSQKLWIVQLVLKTAIWLVMYAVFLKLEFGAVYFVISVIVFLVSSLRARRRKPNELSAYSVFNPNFEVLDGTFTAEQFDSQIRNGGMMR